MSSFGISEFHTHVSIHIDRQRQAGRQTDRFKVIKSD